ncbi:MAG: hypothetical protein KGL35_18435 [Bradyrhizobium sp.]|nr:hypothetical protein [Bradyrhizobium sp.]
MRACEIAERLAAQAETVARMLLPNGKREGTEWRCGGIGGEPGDSLGVHLTGSKAGWWKDFASEQGGDLIGLWMAAKGLDLRAACAEACEFLGINDTRDRPAHHPRTYRKPGRDGVHRLTFAQHETNRARGERQRPCGIHLANGVGCSQKKSLSHATNCG